VRKVRVGERKGGTDLDTAYQLFYELGGRKKKSGEKGKKKALLGDP